MGNHWNLHEAERVQAIGFFRATYIINIDNNPHTEVETSWDRTNDSEPNHVEPVQACQK